VAATLEAAYENVDEEQLARAYIERKRMAQPKDKKEASRTMRRLIAAGFAPPTVFKVLRNWVTDEAAMEELSVEDADEAL
jgi:regulatory protein